MKAVVDANVFIHSHGRLSFEQIYTVPSVLEEVESREGRNTLRNLNYTVAEPSEQALSRVEGLSEEINSPTSEEDEELLALALDRQLVLVTDDKPLQNLALHLEVEFQGFLDEKTDELFKWVKVCRNCGENISSPPCPQCGSRELRRKQVRCSSE